MPEANALSEKGKPAARLGRKATGQAWGLIAGLPKKEAASGLPPERETNVVERRSVMVRRGMVTQGSTWKRIAAWSVVALACGTLLGTSPAAAEPRRNLNRGVVLDIPGADAVLYEVTEKMYLLDAEGNVVPPDLAVVRKADASLFGWSRVGNPLCPS